MTTINYNGSINIEREKSNLLALMKLTLNTLIDQSTSSTALPVLDDRNADVTNFIITLERILGFRMRAGWLSERHFFWDFIRPACIGACRQSIIERVEEISNTRNLKDKGRTWIKLALMEKKLSELLKLVISDCHLVRKFYHDDAILTSSQAFILCDQLAGLNAIDFSFCFKQDGIVLAPLLLNDAEIDVIDITPFLCYKSRQMRSLLQDQNNHKENQQSSPVLAEMNELKTINSSNCETVSLDKFKLEVEQRKYFEELLRHRDNEYQKLKIRYETLKGERESEIIQMENIILELQLELRAARDEAETKRKRPQISTGNTPPKNQFQSNNQKQNSSPTTPTNEHCQSIDIQIHSNEIISSNNENKNINSNFDNVNEKQSSSRRSSHSTTNTDDDQYELVRKLSSNNHIIVETKLMSSPEVLSSATSFSIPSSTSSDEDDERVQTVTTTTPDEKKTMHFEPDEIKSE